ncbi:MAG: hypothetical protein ACI81O_000787 [Cyclobacteriaceae bacterium]|jgi:hypothetical protein
MHRRHAVSAALGSREAAPFQRKTTISANVTLREPAPALIQQLFFCYGGSIIIFHHYFLLITSTNNLKAPTDD